MRRILLVLGAVALFGATADAGPLRNLAQRVRGGGGCATATATATASPGYASAASSVSYGDSAGVQWKADAQARSGRCFHPGGGFVPGANYEGVGFSSASPQHALAMCCNNGGAVVAQAVAQGPGGWYAVKQYGDAGPLRQAVGGVLYHGGAAVQSVGAAVQMPFFRPTVCGPNGCR